MGNLDKMDIRPHINKADNYRIWIDYLRFNFQYDIEYLENIKKHINTTNSNTFHDWQYTFLKMTTPTWEWLQILVSYNGQAIPIMSYIPLRVWLVNPLIQAPSYVPKNRLDFYWAFFRLQEVWELEDNFINDFIWKHSVEDPRITRIDYCVDLFYKKKRLWIISLPELIPWTESDYELYKKDLKKYESSNRQVDMRTSWIRSNSSHSHYHHYYWKHENSWSVWNRKNKRYIIRCYDKLQDIIDKQKFWYYWDYFNWQSVHRIEVEFGASFTRWYFLSTLDFLVVKAKTVMKIWIWFNWSLFYKYSRVSEINEFNKLNLTKIFIGKAKRFHLAWFNPYIMIYSAMINDQEVDKNKHMDDIDDFLKILPLKKF